jgi:hypothetical protein
MELAVGDSTEIELIYHSQGHKGSINKSARVVTNDTTTGTVIIRFTAEVGGYPEPSFPLVITPNDIDFTPVKGKQRTKMAVEIQNVSDKRLKITPSGYPEDLFKIKLSDLDLKPGEKSKLMVKLNRHTDVEQFEKSATFELNDQQKTRFSIPLRKDLSTKKTTQREPVKGTKR